MAKQQHEKDICQEKKRMHEVINQPPDDSTFLDDRN